jgi:hypothetical protein
MMPTRIWLAEPGAFAGDDHVGVHGGLATATQRPAVDGGDDGREIPDGEKGALRPRPIISAAPASAIALMSAGDEHLVRARSAPRLRAVVTGKGGEMRRQCPRTTALSALRAWPVDADDGNAVAQALR